MPVIHSDVDFRTNTGEAVIGMCANTEAPNCLKAALYPSDATEQFLQGSAISVIIATANQTTQAPNEGFNPNNQVMTKTKPANNGAVSGFLTFNANDVVTSGGVAIPQKGAVINYAPLGQGALIWLEVASQNVQNFQNAQRLTNMEISYDNVNGGVKHETNAGQGLKGVQVIQGLTNCRKIVDKGAGKYVLEDCVGILVQLN